MSALACFSFVSCHTQQSEVLWSSLPGLARHRDWGCIFLLIQSKPQDGGDWERKINRNVKNIENLCFTCTWPGKNHHSNWSSSSMVTEVKPPNGANTNLHRSTNEDHKGQYIVLTFIRLSSGQWLSHLSHCSIVLHWSLLAPRSVSFSYVQCYTACFAAITCCYHAASSHCCKSLAFVVDGLVELSPRTHRFFRQSKRFMLVMAYRRQTLC